MRGGGRVGPGGWVGMGHVRGRVGVRSWVGGWGRVGQSVGLASG